MKHTQEEVINALQVIQDTCQEMHEFYPCQHCPLSKNGTCVLQQQTPEEWKINPKPPVWKAFE